MTWTIVGLVLGGLGLGAAVVMGHAFRSSRRRQTLLAAVAEVRTRETVLRRDGEALERAGSATTRLVAGAARTALEATLASARDHLAELRRSISGLPRQVADFETTGVEEVERRLAIARHRAGQSREVVDAAVREIDDVTHRIEGLPVARATALEELQAAVAVATEAGAAGWLIEPHQLRLTSVGDRLDRLDPGAEPLDLVALEEALRSHRAVIAETVEAIAAHPERHRSLVERAEAAAASLAEEHRGQTWAVEQIEAWGLAHHADSWADIADGLDGADRRLDAVARLVDGVRADGGPLSMHRQDHDEAQAAIQRAEAELAGLGAALDAARQRALDLADAQVYAEDRLRAAEGRQRELAQYVADNTRDLEKQFGPGVERLHARLADAATFLGLDPPNWFAAARGAAEIDVELGARLEAARAEVQRMDELRARAARAVASARTAIGRLDDYTDGFLAEAFGSSRRRKVDALGGRLARLGAHDPEEAIRVAPLLEREADELLDQYQRDDAAADEL